MVAFFRLQFIFSIIAVFYGFLAFLRYFCAVFERSFVRSPIVMHQITYRYKRNAVIL